jgi:hypothetical protein
MLDRSNIMNHDVAELIAEFRSRPEIDLDLLGKLVGALYEQYLEISKNIRL